uniref:Pseudouridine synthase I TruA alpha/beta domain-containing protein n=1 Tax=Timema bartmani TaxID=61472 RepID=A0A7R9F747_9NEOP|nr:unnamed protein product [Timema bartmani]
MPPRQELIHRVLQLEAHTAQLRNLLSKQKNGQTSKNHTAKKKRNFDFTNSVSIYLAPPVSSVSIDLAPVSSVTIDLAPPVSNVSIDLAPVSNVSIDLAPPVSSVSIDLAPPVSNVSIDLAPPVSNVSIDLAPPVRCCKRHVLLKVMYLGWDYQGLAKQEDTAETIEQHLFLALSTGCLVESRETSNYHRCGRTDKGVSSFGQTISLDLRSSLSQEQLAADPDMTEGELPYTKILNRLLPEDIRVLAWRPALPDLSARFQCKQRTYKYFFPRGDLNVQVMNSAARFIVGTHDFRNFCKMDVANGVVSFIRSIVSAQVSVMSRDPHMSADSGDTSGPRRSKSSLVPMGLASRSGVPGYDMCVLTLVGHAFLWHQVRCIMGLLLLVGQGKEEADVVQELLDVDSHPRKPQYSMASELPLNLFHCEYEQGTQWYMNQECLTQVVRTLQSTWTKLYVKASMVRAMLLDLESSLETPVSEQTSCLLQGVRSKVYQPLLKRPTCGSLETRIEHYVKRQRLELMEPEDQSSLSAVSSDYPGAGPS